MTSQEEFLVLFVSKSDIVANTQDEFSKKKE